MSGFTPDVPGCASTGHTLAEMRRNLREALEFHLQGLALEGLAMLLPVTRMADIPEEGLAEWLDVHLSGSTYA
jgi:predicted RNase H-like HicB family nuclease